jgi:hypothetical protein
MIAAAGSPFGMRGIVTIPAPRRPRELLDLDEPVRAVRTDDPVEPVEPLRAVAAGCGGLAAGAVPQRSQ